MAIDAVKIVQISDMTPYGHARALVDVTLTPSVLKAFARLSIDVPLQYTGDLSVSQLRHKVLEQVIASLRDAAENLPATPVPLHGLQPSAQPESTEL